MFGTVIDIAFGITSVASGLVLGFSGMRTVLAIAVVATIIAIIGLSLIPIEEESLIPTVRRGRWI